MKVEAFSMAYQMLVWLIAFDIGIVLYCLGKIIYVVLVKS